MLFQAYYRIASILPIEQSVTPKNEVSGYGGEGAGLSTVAHLQGPCRKNKIMGHGTLETYIH